MKDRSSLVMVLKNVMDCKKLEHSIIKYINVDIANPDVEVIRYLLDCNDKYLIADYMDDKFGYVYVTLDKFKDGQNIINNIIVGVNDKSYSEIEIAKYLYVKLSKLVSFDINVIPSKSDIYSFSMINSINNIWDSICLGKVNNVSITKLYLYLCSLMGINCEIVSNNDTGYLINKLNIDNKTIMVDITKDIAFIQAGFKTRYFGNYNDDYELDKKIGYVTNNYNDTLIDVVMKKMDYSLNDFLYRILVASSSIMDVCNMGPQELYIVYEDIFNKYCSTYNIGVNNLYVNDGDKREHFILISYNNRHYGYNYSKKCFVEVKSQDLVDNLNNQNIGFYLDEDIIINGFDTLEEV
jgi:hypothetical protein